MLCSSGGAGGSSEPPIAFGKRYLEYETEGSELSNERAYVFNANGTGYYEFDYMGPTVDINNPYAPYKGKIDFVDVNFGYKDDKQILYDIFINTYFIKIYVLKGDGSN